MPPAAIALPQYHKYIRAERGQLCEAVLLHSRLWPAAHRAHTRREAARGSRAIRRNRSPPPRCTSRVSMMHSRCGCARAPPVRVCTQSQRRTDTECVARTLLFRTDNGPVPPVPSCPYRESLSACAHASTESVTRSTLSTPHCERRHSADSLARAHVCMPRQTCVGAR